MILIRLVLVALLGVLSASHPGDVTDEHNCGSSQGRIYSVGDHILVFMLPHSFRALKYE